MSLPYRMTPVEALASAAPAPARPRLQLAPSLEGLRQGMLVHVDEAGQVRSPARYRALRLLDLGASTAAALLGSALYASFFGPLAGALAAGFFGATVLVSARRRGQMERIAALVAEGRLGEAEALCRRLLAQRLLPARVAAAAHQGLSVVATRRGDFAEALGEVRVALHLLRRWRRGGLHAELLAYSEVGLLVNLERVDEARAALAARGRVPAGDYLRVLHWSAELAVQFAAGVVEIDEDELWTRSRRALHLVGLPHLLALCAWASAARGDDGMSDHLLAEALDRATSDSAVTFPALWRWVDGRRARLAGPVLGG